MPKSDSGASALASLLDGSTAGELIPELARHGLQQLIELEVAAVLGADRHERTEERSGYRNGSRPRLLTTQVGDIPLAIPKLRAGSFFPTILEPRRRIDQALYAVIMEAWVQGVSTRKVDALVEAIGSQAGISRSEVSRICQGLDGQIQAFLERPLDGCRYPYLYLDATYLHGRLGKTLQVCSRAVVVAMGVNADGRRELLGLKVGDSESEPFWREFLASLKQRGLGGVRLVVSDAHVGLTKAVGRMFQGCSWQRCRVHFSRNLLQTVPKAQQEMVAAALRSVFTQQSTAAVEEQWDQVAAMLTAKFPRAADLMATAREDVLAFRHFPASHWRKLWSTNLLERVNVAPRGALGQSSSSNAAPALSASSPTTPRSHAWWARCCWSRTSTGSWRAAACSPSIPWLPFRPAPMPCLNPIRRWLPCHSPQQNVRPQPAFWHAHHRAGRIAGGREPALNPAPPPDRPGMNLLTGHC